MAFLEIQFPTSISYGAAGGPSYSTDVIVLDSGFESRNQNWSVARASWDVAHGIKNQANLDVLIAFFRVAKGKANGFRFKDWIDYLVAQTEGRLGTTAVGTGFAAYQLYKRYSNAAGSEDRIIQKPVSGQTTVYRDSSPVTVGGGAGQIAIDYTTGIITFVADSSFSITAITKADPGVVTTSAPHGFSNGDLIYISGVGGMVEVNNRVFAITGASGSVFSIEDTSGHTTYTTGGLASKFPQPAESLQWAGEFDVPARFDTDKMNARAETYSLFDWGQIPVMEIRV